MFKELKLILYFLLLFCLIACSGKNDVAFLLSKAESYMNERPDSALCVLNSIMQPEDLPRGQYALWCLLYMQAQDKNQIEHRSDSLIQIAVKYYEKSDLEDRKMQAYYFCGRVFQDLNDAPQAQGYYLKAYEVGKNLNNYSLLGRLCANLGTLYTYQELYQPALNLQKEAVDCFIYNKDTASLSMALRNVARVYVCYNQLDSAVYYYSKALLYTSDYYKFYLLNELADTYGRIGDYEKGLSYAKEAYTQIEIVDDSYLISLTLGDLYLKLGKTDSAYHYLSFCRKSTDIYTLKDTYHSLSLLEKSRKNLNAYMFFQEQYEVLRDSMEQQTYKETLTRLQSLYDYQIVEKEKEYYRQEADRKTNYLYRFLGGGSLFLLVTVCIVFYLFREKKKKEEQLNQSLRLQEQKYRESQQYLAERNAAIVELGQKIEIANDLKIQLDMIQGVFNEKMVEHSSCSIVGIASTKIFFTSDLYEGLREKWRKLDYKRWPDIVKWIDHVLYLNFTYKVKMMYPGISDTDLQICCLTRLDIPVSRIAILLSLTSQAVSLRRKRLYIKLTQKQGTAQDFDKWILSL
ncbi:tetratricopeptide repeat protein [Parabacteroides timonensis]|uniref:tetratricopeptide repeat protein n=1 Tax=Parabacteroides timonensis TaxID=1871013 RepID=UPI00094EEAF8|nr:tetratricopeptide repeat protein [Parabacteroides timonensis]